LQTNNAIKRPEAKKTLAEEEKKSVDDSNAKIKELTNALLPVQKKLKSTIIEILDLKAQRKPLPGGDERQNLYTKLKDKKSQRNELQSQVFELKDKLKINRANKYNTLYKKVLCVKMDSSNGDRY
jgi:seryl-tRNA synthetase